MPSRHILTPRSRAEPPDSVLGACHTQSRAFGEKDVLLLGSHTQVGRSLVEEEVQAQSALEKTLNRGSCVGSGCSSTQMALSVQQRELPDTALPLRLGMLEGN